jgi:hypothetical protein
MREEKVVPYNPMIETVPAFLFACEHEKLLQL